MWVRSYQAETHLSPESLWTVLADVNGWAKIDRNIEEVRLEGPTERGARFMLKPKGGPRLQFCIGEFEAPHRYSDICRLPLAEMETKHTLRRTDGGTRIEITIEIRGVLSWLWGRMVGQKHADGLPEQTARFIAAAEQGRSGSGD